MVTSRRLGEAVDAADHAVADGRGLVLSISGEPGAGKTHLAAQALSLAAGQGFRTMRGTCARYQEDVSFAPLVAALKSGRWLKMDNVLLRLHREKFGDLLRNRQP
jgi:predicted ATPase